MRVSQTKSKSIHFGPPEAVFVRGDRVKLALGVRGDKASLGDCWAKAVPTEAVLIQLSFEQMICGSPLVCGLILEHSGASAFPLSHTDKGVAN